LKIFFFLFNVNLVIWCEYNIGSKVRSIWVLPPKKNSTVER